MFLTLQEAVWLPLVIVYCMLFSLSFWLHVGVCGGELYG